MAIPVLEHPKRSKRIRDKSWSMYLYQQPDAILSRSLVGRAELREVEVGGRMSNFKFHSVIAFNVNPLPVLDTYL